MAPASRASPQADYVGGGVRESPPCVRTVEGPPDGRSNLLAEAVATEPLPDAVGIETDVALVDVVAALADVVDDADRLRDVLVAGEPADRDEPVLALGPRARFEALARQATS